VILTIIHLSEQSFKEKFSLAQRLKQKNLKKTAFAERSKRRSILISPYADRSRWSSISIPTSHCNPFVCSLQSGKVKALEHAQAIWVAIDQLLDYDWADADKPIVNEYIAYAKTIE